MARKGLKHKIRKWGRRCVPRSFVAYVFVVGIVMGLGAYLFVDRVLPLLSGPSTRDQISQFLENYPGASVSIAAVSSGAQPQGVISTLAVRIGPGDGRIYVDIDPLLVGFDFQDASRTAVRVASSITGYALDDDGQGLAGYDVFLLVIGPGGKIDVQAIDGPSAGAATTVAMIATLENKSVKEGHVITGTIGENGSIGQVGGVFYKAQAANEAGANYFLVPDGQSTVTIYQEVVRQIGGYQWVFYEPVLLDMNQYAENQGWNLQLIEVSDIQGAVALMLE